MSLAIYHHDDCLQHNPGPGHVESPDRLRAVHNAMISSHLADELSFVDAPLGQDTHILLAHTEDHLAYISNMSLDTGFAAIDGDTIMSTGSMQAARRATGATCQATEDVLAGKCDSAFCATRPPGHHATRGRAMGFCLFNHIAIAALHARRNLGLSRVALVDFDVHHGNGSQDILLGQDGILFISTHQSPLYPGSGDVDENVPGNILNVPFAAGTDGDSYRPVFEQQVLSALDAFRPELILVSAGFDAHRHDPLASMALQEEDYQWLGNKLKGVARQHCEGRIVATLEGGYNLEVLGASVVAFLDGLLSA